jgi:hypothetical protein
MCTHCTLFFFLSLPSHLLLPTSATPPLPRRTYSALLFSDFVEEKTIKDKKRNMTFLLV